MKTIIFLLCLGLFSGCSLLFQPFSSSAPKEDSPKLLSSCQAISFLADKNIFLHEVFLVFDMDNSPTVRWSGYDSISKKVYSIDTYAQNVITKTFENEKKIKQRLYLGGEPYQIENSKKCLQLIPIK